jgi:hypothetical protein
MSQKKRVQFAGSARRQCDAYLFLLLSPGRTKTGREKNAKNEGCAPKNAKQKKHSFISRQLNDNRRFKQASSSHWRFVFFCLHVCSKPATIFFSN